MMGKANRLLPRSLRDTRARSDRIELNLCLTSTCGSVNWILRRRCASLQIAIWSTIPSNSSKSTSVGTSRNRRTWTCSISSFSRQRVNSWRLRIKSTIRWCCRTTSRRVRMPCASYTRNRSSLQTGSTLQKALLRATCAPATESHSTCANSSLSRRFSQPKSTGYSIGNSRLRACRIWCPSRSCRRFSLTSSSQCSTSAVLSKWSSTPYNAE